MDLELVSIRLSGLSYPISDMENVDPNTGLRQDIVSDQDLKNGLGSILEFVGEAFRVAGKNGANPQACEQARAYCRSVAADIITGKGRRAPNPGPVTPQK